VHVDDDDGHRQGHAAAGQDDQRFPVDVVQHGVDHTTNDAGQGQKRGDGDTIPLDAAVVQHVHRVKQQHVEPAALLADKEQCGDQGRLPDGRAGEQCPVRDRGRFVRGRVSVRAAQVIVAVDRQRGDRRRRRDGHRGWFNVQPRLGRVRFPGPAAGPEPHGRLRHEEH